MVASDPWSGPYASSSRQVSGGQHQRVINVIILGSSTPIARTTVARPSDISEVSFPFFHLPHQHLSTVGLGALNIPSLVGSIVLSTPGYLLGQTVRNLVTSSTSKSLWWGGFFFLLKKARLGEAHRCASAAPPEDVFVC